MTTYSANLFANLAHAYGQMPPEDNLQAVAAALRIASRVMEPGVIEEAATCPFQDPKFSLDPNTPCPVCGDLGIVGPYDDESEGDEGRCVDNSPEFRAAAIREKLTGGEG